MGRNLQPTCKTCRRIGESVCGRAKCAVIRRSYAPGAAGARNTRRRLSQYGLQLREKQKAKALYGVLEKQFSNYYKKASGKAGNTGDVLLGLLETRLDNVVYRAGYATTRRQARQLVTHGHFLVNGTRCDIPSRQVKEGDVIELREKSQGSAYFQQNYASLESAEVPTWLAVDAKKNMITVSGQPQKEDFEQGIAVNLIVEFYSR